ncbi:cell division protein ZapA [Porticoccus litoralis]|uniref:Cell division protein ZapA n=1 Tax=Porticoccus litoralis TaxID=434086 RepID=A0AAW8B4Z7_9GAMM|nr:cell division protein ZapA [Porticoccus litoralis]MDP1520639.1 cell division protein ZapA [Porticoccus litoralis]
MSQQTVNIRILDKEYQVSCPPEERDALLYSARALDERMRTIRNSGSVIGLERIAVMAALNLTYDLTKLESQTAGQSLSEEAFKRLDNKLDTALQSFETTTSF